MLPVVRPAWSWVLASSLIAGCGAGEPPPGPALTPARCAAGELETPEACMPAGIAEADCGEGFASDGSSGCTPMLPADRCPQGTMAIPGDASCRPVGACTGGKWGGIDTSGAAVFVDASFTGPSSGGTAALPYASIQQAIAAAPTGAIIAVAAGTYTEDVYVTGKVLTLWGECPDRVRLRGQSGAYPALQVFEAPPGVMVRGLTVEATGSPAMAIDGALDVTVMEVVLTGAGPGLVVQSGMFGPASVALSGSLLEDGAGWGALVAGASLSIEGSLLRRARLEPGQNSSGRGVQAVGDAGGATVLDIVSSVIEDNEDVGVLVSGAEAAFDAVVVRGTRGSGPGASGRGVVIRRQSTTDLPATVALSHAYVDDNLATGVFVSGSDLDIEHSVIRATRFSVPLTGRGIEAWHAGAGKRARLGMRSSLVDLNHGVGLLVSGSDARVEATLVRGTQPTAGSRVGRNVMVQVDETGLERGAAELVGVVSEGGVESGVHVLASSVVADGLLVRGVAPALDGSLGDGVAVVSNTYGRAEMTIMRSRAEGSRRAGLSSFGATFAVGSSAIQCNAIDLTGATFMGHDAAFDDGGGNVCGCGEPIECRVVSPDLEPPLEPAPE